MSYIIGHRIPEPWYGFARDKRVARPVLRRCQSCRYVWGTVEIPIFSKWQGGAVDHCPRHIHAKGPAVTEVSPQQADHGGRYSTGLEKARRMGGVYRRRMCSLAYCMDGNTTLGKKRGARRTRWSTMEVLATGLVCDNVTSCPRCTGGRGRVVYGKKSVQRAFKDLVGARDLRPIGRPRR
jgi:hypothetical protein